VPLTLSRRYSKQKYKLTVTLFHCNKSFWSQVRSIEDLVKPTVQWEDEPGMGWYNKLLLFRSPSQQHQLQFLASCIEEMVNNNLSSRSTKWRTGLLYNLKKITKHKMYLDKVGLDKQTECVKK